ncbi:hypothetical protein A3Q56_01084 [Intoshia linei]|uniref:Sodium/hydrogen exchanger n=1 Tax=Intoshia linei TaxID=1819745 RepID=A0A177BBY9_9BILA|nr:hypothetical protein A3Q56_01084 [Intoshia linei]
MFFVNNEIKCTLSLKWTVSIIFLIFIYSTLITCQKFPVTANTTITNIAELKEINDKPNKSKEIEAEEITDAEKSNEEHASLSIFIILFIITGCILIIHVMITKNINFIPESIVIIIIGAIFGGIVKLLSVYDIVDWRADEHFPPTTFFVVLLPPIIFESGYSLHKGDYFQNIGTILVFAIIGTVFSSIVIGVVMYLIGLSPYFEHLSAREAFAFGALISAVDPVATLAIFKATDVDPMLYMLVFGESVMNDAVAIVLTTTILNIKYIEDINVSVIIIKAIGQFLLVFFGSALIGIIVGLCSSLLLKHICLKNTPSLEIAMMLILSYVPYALCDSINLSGIMAILMCGIVMSHYTHYNLSAVSQVVVLQTFRVISFLAETCVFAYLGLSIFSYKHHVKASLICWGLVAIFLGRAVNIFPLSHLVNKYRVHKITRRNQLILWFSGLRGAVSFALSMYLDVAEDKRNILVSTTLIIVLLTIIFLGGGTIPLLHFIKKYSSRYISSNSVVTMSKTEIMGSAANNPQIPQEDINDTDTRSKFLKFLSKYIHGFTYYDVKYFRPFFLREFTIQEISQSRDEMVRWTNNWCNQVVTYPSPTNMEDNGIDFDTEFDPTL